MDRPKCGAEGRLGDPRGRIVWIVGKVGWETAVVNG